MTWVDATEPVLVVNLDGVFHAVQGICSHEYFELDKGFLTDDSLTCALHLSRFDLASRSSSRTRLKLSIGSSWVYPGRKVSTSISRNKPRTSPL